MPTLELKAVERGNGLPALQWLVLVDGKSVGIVTDTLVRYSVYVTKGYRTYETRAQAANALLRDQGIKGRF
jgi:hypothetical protein